MSDLYSQIVSKRSGLERIIARIPGFKGYKEMGARREADRMMREHVVKLLKEQMQQLISVEKKMLTGGGLSFASKASSAKSQFQTFIDRVGTAAPGYSGFYDAQKVGPEELERIYSFDAALLDYVEQYRGQIDNFEKQVTTKGDIDGAIGLLETLGQEANSAFSLRNNVLTEIY